jgi:hypothetical protein
MKSIDQRSFGRVPAQSDALAVRDRDKSGANGTLRSAAGDELKPEGAAIQIEARCAASSFEAIDDRTVVLRFHAINERPPRLTDNPTRSPLRYATILKRPHRFFPL